MTRYNDQVIVLLAAGNSSRMGTSKQMLSVNGRTLLEHSVNCATASQIPNVIVVFGAHAQDHQVALKGRPITIEINQQWANGMGSSLKAGLRKAIQSFSNVQALMVLVCDQPLLSSVHINRLASAYYQSKPLAVASQYNNGVVGVPAIFDRSVFSSLMQIEDKSGAREVLEKLNQDLVLIPFIGGEIDLDTPEDLKRYINGEYL